jgi:phosphoglycerol transferase MdoB-like AlkP superfamily enzyme
MKRNSLIKPPKTIVYWAGIFILGMLFLSFIRLLFLWRHWHLAQPIPGGEIISALFYGLKFDMSVMGYLIIPFFVLSYIPYIGFEYSRLGRNTIQTVFYTLFAIVILLDLIDIEYYGAFGDHLGVWFYTYLDQPGMVWYSIRTSTPVFQYLIGWAILTAIFTFAAIRLNRLFRTKASVGIPTRIFYFVVGGLFLAISMRGSFSVAALDWGGAYHAKHYFTNELSLNGTFTLSRSLYEYYNDISRHNPKTYKFMPSGDALRTVQELVVSKSDSLLEPESSLKRISRYPKNDSVQYNVVIIFMESWAARFVGALGCELGVTPFFDSLASKSILFENMYASGMRTNRGLLSVLCSFPSLPGRTVMKLYGASLPFTSLPEILSERGYQSYFIYGGDLMFDNMGGFFRKQGIENFIGIEDFPNRDESSKWGIPDHIMLARANQIFAQSPQPFFGAILTLSNHDPFVLPDKSFEVFPESLDYHEGLNAFRYSDWALGRFFESASKEPYFNNTIFVLVADHSHVMDKPDDIIGNFRIASLIYSPGHPDITPQRISRICGQVDIPPSLLHLLGGTVVHESWGIDIFDSTNQGIGFAFINNGANFGWLEDSLLFYERVGTSSNLFRWNLSSQRLIDISDKYPAQFRRMQHNGRAMLQLEVEMTHQGLSK